MFGVAQLLVKFECLEMQIDVPQLTGAFAQIRHGFTSQLLKMLCAHTRFQKAVSMFEKRMFPVFVGYLEGAPFSDKTPWVKIFIQC